MESRKVLVWYNQGVASPLNSGGDLFVCSCSRGSLTWLQWQGGIFGVLQAMSRGSLLRDRRPLRVFTWLIPHRGDSPGCPWVPEECEQTCAELEAGEAVLSPLAMGYASGGVHSSRMVAEV